MAKKFLSKLLTSAILVTGATLALKYFKQYKDLDTEIEGTNLENFSDKREYTVLKSKTNDFINAFKETTTVAKNMATPAKEILNEVGNIVNNKVKSFVSDSNADIKENDLDYIVDEDDIKELKKIDTASDDTINISIITDEDAK